MDKLEIKQGSFIQQTQYFIPMEIDLTVLPARLGIWFFHLSRRTTVIQDLLVRRQFSLVPDNRTNVNVEACSRKSDISSNCTYISRWSDISPTCTISLGGLISSGVLTLKSTGGPLLSVLNAKHRACSKRGNVAQSFLDRPPGEAGSSPGISGYPPVLNIQFHKQLTDMFTGGPLLSVLKPKHNACWKPGNVAQSFLDKPPGLEGEGPGLSG